MALECIMFYKWLICFNILKTCKARQFLKTLSNYFLASEIRRTHTEEDTHIQTCKHLLTLFCISREVLKGMYQD